MEKTFSEVLLQTTLRESMFCVNGCLVTRGSQVRSSLLDNLCVCKNKKMAFLENIYFLEAINLSCCWMPAINCLWTGIRSPHQI